MIYITFNKLNTLHLVDIRIAIKKKYPKSTVTRCYPKNKKKEKILPPHQLVFSICPKSRKVKKLTDVTNFDKLLETAKKYG